MLCGQRTIDTSFIFYFEEGLKPAKRTIQSVPGDGGFHGCEGELREKEHSLSSTAEIKMRQAVSDLHLTSLSYTNKKYVLFRTLLYFFTLCVPCNILQSVNDQRDSKFL